MKWMRRLLVCCLLGACAGQPVATTRTAQTGALTARPTETPSAPSSRRGYFRLRGDAQAAVYVPPSYRPDQPAPLALVLHGASARADPILGVFTARAKANGVILLAPESKDFTWDTVDAYLRNAATRQSPYFGADLPRIDAALNQVFAGYAIDPARVAVIGFSDGGSYAIALGGYNPDLFSSVLAYSPGFAVAMPNGPRPRVYIAHGRSDPVIPATATTQSTAPILQRYGFEVKVELFDGKHEIKKQQMTSGFKWWLDANADSLPEQ